MTMVNMKRKKQPNEDMIDAGDLPPYPYGLQLRLNEEDMKKLDLKLMETGTEITITAKTIITSVSQYDYIDEKETNNANMTLQITDMEIDKVHDSDVAKRFYGEDEDDE